VGSGADFSNRKRFLPGKQPLEKKLFRERTVSMWKLSTMFGNVVTECIKEYQKGNQITSLHSIHKNMKNSSFCLRSALHGRHEFNEENSEDSKNDPDVLETCP